MLRLRGLVVGLQGRLRCVDEGVSNAFGDPALEDAVTAEEGRVDPDLSAAVSYSLQQTVEARLRGVRNYTRLLREVQQQR